MHMNMGDFDSAVPLLEEAMATYRQREAPGEAAHMCHLLAKCHLNSGRPDAALALMDIVEAIGFSHLHSHLELCGEILRVLGRHREALAVQARLEAILAHQRRRHRRNTGEEE